MKALVLCFCSLLVLGQGQLRVTRCTNDTECDEDECCIIVKRGDIIGKRQLQDVKNSTTELPTVKPTSGEPSSTAATGSTSDQLTLEQLQKLLAELQNHADKINNPMNGTGKILAELNDLEGKGIHWFNEIYGKSTIKKGVCRKMGQEGDRCALHSSSQLCPCLQPLACQVDKSHKFGFGGFGAIKGLHDLKCLPASEL